MILRCAFLFFGISLFRLIISTYSEGELHTMLLHRATLAFGIAAVLARVPALCYDPCTDAQIEGNLGQWARSLCTPGTPFRQNLEDCLACIDANEHDGVSLDDLGAFGGVIGFCL